MSGLEIALMLVILFFSGVWGAIKYVDEVIIYCTEDDLCDIINMYPIDIRILGEEYRDRDFTGKDECKKRGIQLYFNKREHRFSTSDLRKRVCEKTTL